MSRIDHNISEPSILKRLASAMQTNDTILCGDMIDGAIEIARRQREETGVAGSSFAKSRF